MTPEDGGGTDDRTEVESTLLVAPERGEELAAEVASVEELAGHPVRRREPLELEDAYLDTPDDDLGRAGLALRVRRAGGEVLVAVKGDDRPLPGGGTRRLELERRWSHEALAEVGELLSARGFAPPAGEWPEAGRGAGGGPGSGRGEGRAVAALERLGFVVVQRRTTLRRRAAVAAGDGGRPVAELDVDRVGYRLRAGRSRTVVHREVEVEGAAGDAGDVVPALTRALRRRFGDGLRPWGHDKLATGRALDHLADRGELDALAGPEGELTDRAYARIDALLAGSGA